MALCALVSDQACAFERPTKEELKARAQEPVFRVIGPRGDILRGPGVIISVPAGALDHEVELSVRLTADKPEAPFRAYSFVYEFEPSELVFHKPVRVELSTKKPPEAARPVMFWFDPDEAPEATDAGFMLDASVTEELITTFADKTATAHTLRFGHAFVADSMLPMTDAGL